jgi:hypothetical protein
MRGSRASWYAHASMNFLCSSITAPHTVHQSTSTRCQPPRAHRLRAPRQLVSTQTTTIALLRPEPQHYPLSTHRLWQPQPRRRGTQSHALAWHVCMHPRAARTRARDRQADACARQAGGPGRWT